MYGYARSINANKSASALATMGTISIPLVAFGALESGADVPGIAFVAAAIYFVFVQSASATTRMILAGMCVGMAFGFKSLHLVSVGVLAMLIAARAFGVSEFNSKWRAAGETTRQLALFAVSTFAMASFWLVRDWILFGNPVYPVYIAGLFDLLGWKMAPDVNLYDRHFTQFEWVHRPRDWLTYPWWEWNEIGKYFSSNSGLGPFFAATVPVSLLGIAAGWATRRIRLNSGASLLLLGGCIVAAVWWALDERQPRYAMGALVYLMPVTAWVVSRTSGVRRTLVNMV